jgi:D-methionine transport system permease protein
MTDLVLNSFYETVFMVGGAALLSVLIGFPVGIVLSVTASGGLYNKPWINCILSGCVNALRSIPYIILVVLLMPLTRILAGSSIGSTAAIIPLGLAGGLLVARVVEESMRMIPQGMIEVGTAMGASRPRIVVKIILSEAWPSICSGLTMVLINLIGFSAMAGAVGGGGLGDLAIRYGYQRYDITLLVIIVILLIAMVQAVQTMGNLLTRKLSK